MQISQTSNLEYLRLGDHVEVKGRIGWKGLKKEEYTNEGPFMISGNNLLNREIRWEDCFHINEFRYQESPEIQLQLNDIIMTKDGTIGRLGFIEDLPGPATINSTIVLIRAFRSSRRVVSKEDLIVFSMF
jgi:type I restriction enzyme, S subunit